MTELVALWRKKTHIEWTFYANGSTEFGAKKTSAPFSCSPSTSGLGGIFVQVKTKQRRMRDGRGPKGIGNAQKPEYEGGKAKMKK